MGLLHKLGLLNPPEETDGTVESPENSEMPAKEVKKSAPVNSPNPVSSNPKVSKFTLAPEKPATPGQIVGEVDEKIFENLSDAIDKNNLPGNDFLEFMQSLNSLKDMAVDEKTKFNMVFATLKSAAGGMDKETLVKSIQHYVNVVNKEQEIFVEEMKGATSSMVDANLNESQNLTALVQKKSEQIQKLNEEILELNNQIGNLNSVAEESKFTIAKKQADFDVTTNVLLSQLEDYNKKINQYIQ